MRRCTRRLLVQQPTAVRWNSTIPSQEHADPSNPNPTPASPATRRFPKLRVDDGTPYALNLDAIAAAATRGSLSARLAAARATQQPAQESAPLNTDPAVSSEKPDESAETQRVETVAGETASASQPRPFPTPIPQEKLEKLAQEESTAVQHAEGVVVLTPEQITQARRDERLAREATRLPQPPPFSQEPSTPAFVAPSLDISPEEAKAAAEAAVLRRREDLLARRAERLARPGNSLAKAPLPRISGLGQTPNFGERSEPGQRPPLGMGRGLPARGGMSPQIGAGRGESSMRGGIRGRGRGRGRGGGGGGGGRRRNRGEEGSEDNDDFMSEIGDWLESGEEVASALAPELPTSSLRRELNRRPPTSKPTQPKELREAVGGDYSRFVPQNPQLFIASARKIGPVSHSSVVLAQAKQVFLENRIHVKKVVGTVAKTSS